MMLPFEDVFSPVRSVLILGFGREGQSTYRFLQRYYPHCRIGVADKNPDAVAGELPVTCHLGEEYLNALSGYDLIIKSPGIRLEKVDEKLREKITSQTDLFLQAYGRKTIGVTGTKGKSTTVSLIHHLLQKTGFRSVLMGNIGLPAFDFIDRIEQADQLVYELSAHQLQDVHASPHIAVLLNIYPEHLDYFGDFEKYKAAKQNIFRFQQAGDKAVCGEKPEGVSFFCDEIRGTDLQKFQEKDLLRQTGLKGQHNLKNILVAFKVLQYLDVDESRLSGALAGFKGLPHRMEYVGNFGGIDFYNDSISTVPESAMAAVQSIPETDTLILGGYDRGVDYRQLIRFLSQSAVQNFFFIGQAGERMYTLFLEEKPTDKNLIPVENLQEVFVKLKSLKAVSCCLLSPAAASYDQFHNFEHRGDLFKKEARQFSPKK